MNERTIRVLPLLLLLAACSETAPEPSEPPAPVADDADDLPLGDLSDTDGKADGHWGHATECKPVPDLPPLEQPEIHLSIDGLTLRLYDPVTGFEKVYPVGAGAIDHDESSPTYGESYSAWPLWRTGGNRFRITPRTIQPCKIWHTPSGLPVFAGLPFLSFHGNYGIHGPIDDYRSPDGGDLRRGYVSHGCFRMESEDIREVYARIKGVPEVPVYLHREPERTADGRRVDVDEAWIGSECADDADCNFEGGFCKRNPYSGRGWCTTACDRFCPDRKGYPGTLCITDPDDDEQGICVNRLQSENAGCRPYDHFVPATRARFGQPGYRTDVCVPGTPGFIGDGCLTDADCLGGLTCAPIDADRGQCVQPCDRFCPDLPGYPTTFCIADPPLDDSGRCVRTCDPTRNAPECAAGLHCVERARIGQPDRTEHVCLPL